MNAPTITKNAAPGPARISIGPFGPFQREINRFMGELGEGWGALTESRLSPRMDVADTDGAVEITVELPGLSKDDVKITVEDEMLVVSGEKRAEHERKDRTWRLLERSYGAFTRAIYLPRTADPSRIEASMTDGVLKITAPKTGEAATKTIDIRTS